MPQDLNLCWQCHQQLSLCGGLSKAMLNYAGTCSTLGRLPSADLTELAGKELLWWGDMCGLFAAN